MKNKKVYFILLFIIIYIVILAILRHILQNNDWYLRSWVYKSAIIIVNMAVIVFFILRLKHNVLKIKKLLISIVFIILMKMEI